MAPPDFTNRAQFPSFNDLPEQDDDSQPNDPNSPENQTPTPTLIAQIKDDMTITKPTLILTDRDSTPFALTFDGYDREEGIKFLKSRNLKKGATVVLRNGLARKVAPREDSKSGKGFIRVPRGKEFDVEVIGAKMEKVFEIVERFRGAEEDSLTIRQKQDGEGGNQEQEEKEKEKGRCDTCGKVGGGEDGSVGLFKCTGCGVARYCSKECQVKGWTDDGHKADCKAIKGIITIWGR